MDRVSAAKSLFLEGFSQRDIATFFKLSENTVSTWAKKGSWREKRMSEDLMRRSITEDCLYALAYQSRALRALAEQYEKDFEDTGKYTLIEKGEWDAVMKAHTVIKREKKTWEDFVKVSTEILEWIGEEDLTLAQQLAPKIDRFLQQKRRVL